jgi:hypothetical protein
MTKYKIIVREIEVKKVTENVWVRPEERKDQNESYVDTVVEKQIETEVYSQTVEHAIDLMGVVTAFNKKLPDQVGTPTPTE